MMSNLDRYKTDLESLIETGKLLDLLMRAECYPELVKEVKKKGSSSI